MYKIAKMRDEETRNLTKIKCIKNETKMFLVNDEVIKEPWKRYFYNLFDEVNSNEIMLGELGQSEQIEILHSRKIPM